MYNEDMFYLSTGVFFIFSFVFWLILLAYKVIIMWKVFQKAGKNGWEAIIPFYNIWTLFEISGYPGYLVLFLLIPYVGFIVLFVFKILAALSLAKKFGKDEGFGICLLWLFSLIGYSILAFGKAKYDPNKGNQKETKRNVYTNIEDNLDDEDIRYCKYCGTKNSIDEKKCQKCNKELK